MTSVWAPYAGSLVDDDGDMIAAMCVVHPEESLRLNSIVAFWLSIR